jgi:hypothetical protein
MAFNHPLSEDFPSDSKRNEAFLTTEKTMHRFTHVQYPQALL